MINVENLKKGMTTFFHLHLQNHKIMKPAKTILLLTIFSLLCSSSVPDALPKTPSSSPFSMAEVQMAEIYVNAATGDDNNGGASWNDALQTLQAALDIATFGDKIYAAAGAYSPTRESDPNVADPRSVTFLIPDGVELYGGFAGTEAPIDQTALDARDLETNASILNGDIGVPDDAIDNAYHVVYTINVSGATIVDGFTITGGNATGSSGGGGWLNLATEIESVPVLRNILFKQNSSAQQGGGMSNSNLFNDVNASPMLINCTFLQNSASYGGGFANEGTLYGISNPTFINCVFLQNSANQYGGGIYNWGYYNLDESRGSASPTIINCTFSLNTAPNGGGMYNRGAPLGKCQPDIQNAIFWNNTAVNGGHSWANDASAAPTVAYTLAPEAGQATITSGAYVGTAVGAGMIYNQDPLFVNPSTDLKLQAGSPAINAGDNAAVPPAITTDLAGATRIQNSSVDLGAYEKTVCLPITSTVESAPETCPGANDGQIIISGLSGADNYEFTIDNGASWQTASTYSGLPPGDYAVRVRNADDTACSTKVRLVTVAAAEGPSVWFTVCPGYIELQADNLATCENESYQPLVQASGCGVSSQQIQLTFTRSDGQPLEGPWPLGSTTITCTATHPVNGESVDCQWTVAVAGDKCENEELCRLAAVTCYSGGGVNGVVAAVDDLSQVTNQSTGVFISGPPTTQAMWTRSEMGEVFGIAYDAAGNIYFTATSIYGYTPPSSTYTYGPLGAGGIYKVKANDLTIDNDWNLTLDDCQLNCGGATNPIAPGLGNICYEPTFDRLLVTNFEDGTINMINPNDQTIVQTYDPGEPDDGSPGFAPLGERLWGITTRVNDLNEVEVYYAVWQTDMRYDVNVPPIDNGHNTIRRVKLNSSGLIDPATDEEVFELPFLETSITGNNTKSNPLLSCPVSDIAFSRDGKTMLLAERSMRGDLRQISNNNRHLWAHNARLLEYIAQGNSWVLARRINMGTALQGQTNNSAGGVSFGNGFDFDVEEACDVTVWATGDYLLNTQIYGMQGFTLENPDISNTTSFLVDFNGISGLQDKALVGDVEIFRCDNCREKDCGNISGLTAYNCDPPGAYTYSLQFENNTEFEVTSVILNAVTPGGLPLSDQYFNFFQTPIPPNGGVSETMEITIDPGEFLTSPLEVCFDVIYLTNGDECCHYQHCLTLEPVDVCELTSVESRETGEDCCHEVLLVNDYCPDYFVGILTEILTPNLTFAGYEGGDAWTADISAEENSILWTPAEGAIPLGGLTPLQFCLSNIMSLDQIPQQVAVSWLALDPATGEPVIVCAEILDFFCEPCLLLSGTPACDDSGGYTLDYTITNNAGQPSTFYVFEVHTPNVVFEPAWAPFALDDGQSHTGSLSIHSLNGDPLPPGLVVEFKALLFDDTGWCCHLDDMSIVLPDCGEPVCDCGDSRGFPLEVAAGFSRTVDCNLSQVTVIPLALQPCDSVVWTVEGPSDLPIQIPGSTGNEPVTFSFPNNGEYRLCMEVARLDEAGNVCFNSVQFCETFTVNCSIARPAGPANIATLIDGSDRSVLVLYPNPVSNDLHFFSTLSGEHEVQIIDANGQLLRRREMNLSSGQIYSVPAGQLANGLYLLRLLGNNGEGQQKRFVKMDD
jgi:predicted outer membrane repeat protein